MSPYFMDDLADSLLPTKKNELNGSLNNTSPHPTFTAALMASAPTPALPVDGSSGSAARHHVNGNIPTTAPTRGSNNGNTTSTKSRSNACNIKPASPDSIHDLVCVGFGPASLAIAVALDDAIASNTLPSSSPSPKVLFLEKQNQFAWHAGMLLPGAKMQISFLKDMATMRDPRSRFTFLSYLHSVGRLVEFMNLGTFLPARVEYEDYLRWCASHFDGLARYGQEVLSISPDDAGVDVEGGAVKSFTVTSRDEDGVVSSYRAKNVVVAIGGQASIPKCLPQRHPRVIHSSRYAHLVPKILSDVNAPYRVAVVGAGQSAAEIFNNIQHLYPNSRTNFIMRQEFLRPSDDSPFVNSIFNPSFTNTIFSRPPPSRAALITEARATNYGVVRLELIEHLYEKMYDQHRDFGPDETLWNHRIRARRDVVGLEESANLKQAPKLRLRPIEGAGSAANSGEDDELVEVDLVIVATGYNRTAHLPMLQSTWPLLPPATSTTTPRWRNGWDVMPEEDGVARSMEVSREYKVQFDAGKVADGSGVWLQGCCEGTHGLSDTLLSVLADRSGEIVDSIFGKA